MMDASATEENEDGRYFPQSNVATGTESSTPALQEKAPTDTEVRRIIENFSPS
jgi:hypothetical protein